MTIHYPFLELPFIRPILAALFLAPCVSPLRAQNPADSIVVLVSVDGLAHYYLDDPQAEMPTIRRLAQEGARAKMMKASMPTVTWPNHTTLVTGVEPGRHAVIGNSYYDRAKGEVVQLIVDPVFNKEELVTSPTIYDHAKKAGLKTASILWPATRGAPTLDWTLPEVGSKELIEKYTTPGLLKEFEEAGIPQDLNIEWRSQNNRSRARERLFLDMFLHTVRTHRPNLALLHLVDLDHVEHAHGPQSPEAYSTLKFEDGLIREIWDTLKAEYGDRATLIVASDHGFFAYRRQIFPNILLRQEGALTAVGSKITGGTARALAQGGSSFVYVKEGADHDAQTQRLSERFKGVDGIDLIIPAGGFAKYGLLTPDKDPRMPDFILCAKDGYSFSDTAAGDAVVSPENAETKGTHGYDPNQPGMHATFVACGAGIKPGAQLGVISNTSVAPTMAALLGLKTEGMGKVLSDILVKK